jgi:hypothetical protein
MHPNSKSLSLDNPNSLITITPHTDAAAFNQTRS